MAGEGRRCVTCDGYGHTCVLTTSGLRLLVICEDCEGEGWIPQDEGEAARDQAALAATAERSERHGAD